MPPVVSRLGEIWSVIRDDVGGEYFQITRHFCFDVSALRMVYASQYLL